MHEATFRINHDSIYVGSTEGNDTRIQLWCGNHCDLLHFQTGGKSEHRAQLLDRVETEVGIGDKLQREDEVVLVTEKCLRGEQDALIEEYLYPHNCLYLPPLNYLDGEMLVRVVALTQENLTGFFEAISKDYDVTVESMHELTSYDLNNLDQSIPLLIADEALPTLSERQQEVLVTAFQEGYYDMPRDTTIDEIATTIDIERRTAGEHLMRAEKKIMDSYLTHFLTV